MKKSITCVGLVLLFTLCVGCTRSEVNSNEIANSESNLGTNGEMANGVVANYEQSLVSPQKCKVYNVSIKNIEPELMEELLFDNSVEISTDTENEKTKFDAKDRHGICSPNNFIFYTDKGTKYDDCVSYFKDNPNEIYMNTNTELSFATRSDVTGKVMDFLDKLGLDNQKIVVKDMYGVKKEGFDFYKNYLSQMAAKENDTKISSQAEAVSKIGGEDYYYIDLALTEDEISIYSGGPYFYGAGDNDTFAGTTLSVVYTEKGIEYVVAIFIYQIDGVVNDSDIITFSEAQTLLKNKYDNIFYDGEITFNDAELLYIPFPQNTLGERFEKFIMRPYYVFYGCQNVTIDDEPYTSEFNVFFDAVSGKEL